MNYSSFSFPPLLPNGRKKNSRFAQSTDTSAIGKTTIV